MSANVTLLPLLLSQYFDSNGNPLSGGKIYVYEAGSTSVLANTYTTANGDVVSANPVTLDSAGRLNSQLWIGANNEVNIVLTQSDGTTVINTSDNTRGTITSEYVTSVVDALANTYLPLSGGSITGGLTVNATTSLKATNIVGNFNVTGNTTINGNTVINSPLSMANNKITDVATPTANNDAATKKYVDDATGGVQVVPIGGIILWTQETPPTNFLECSGAAISRTTYSELFNVIGITFGAGDASTTFNLPNLRGVFVRGWDNGRGVDIGRNFGTFQEDDFETHNHTPIYLGGSNQDIGDPGQYVLTNSAEYNGIQTIANSATANTGGTETRPKNLALMYVIKYQ